MSSENFKCWLEGFLEGKDELDQSEVKIVKEKMKEVGIDIYPYFLQSPAPGLDTTNTPYHYGPTTTSKG